MNHLKNQIGGSKADTIVKLSLVFFISLLSFSVGTFVGKQVSDSDRRKASLEEDYAKFRGTASVDHSVTDIEPEKAITDEDIASLTDEFVESDNHGNKHDMKKDEHANEHVAANDHAREPSSAHKKDAHGYTQFKSDKKEEHAKPAHKPAMKKEVKHAPKHVEPAHKETAHPVAKPTKAVTRVLKDKAPVKDHKRVRTPSSVLPKLASSSIGKYTVQVASYAEEKEARAHAASLKTKGFSAFYLSAKIKGKNWFRVSVGLFDSYDTAQNFRKELKKQAGVQSSIVQKIIR